MTANSGVNDQSPPVAVRRLRLTDFRNYESLDLNTGPGPVVLIGANGAGKTNLLEAVSFLSPGRGLRRAAYDEVARIGGTGGWAVASKIDGGLGPADIGTGLSVGPDGVAERQRRILIEHAPAKSAEALLDHLRVSWLTPAMDGLFSGPAGERRRFLDRMVLAVDKTHAGRVNALERALRSRNRLLETPRPDAAWLDAIEAQIAELAIAVAAARHDLVGRLAAGIDAARNPETPFPYAELGLSGIIEAAVGTAPAVEIEDAYRARLADARAADARAGRTLEGPHRADLIVVHGPKRMPAARCSTGEQKALLVGLVLAHALLVRETSGLAPILLLDEIAAHLDAVRRQALFARLKALGGQAWMTGTDRSLFAPLEGEAQVFAVAEGTVATV